MVGRQHERCARTAVELTEVNFSEKFPACTYGISRQTLVCCDRKTPASGDSMIRLKKKNAIKVAHEVMSLMYEVRSKKRRLSTQISKNIRKKTRTRKYNKVGKKKTVLPAILQPLYLTGKLFTLDEELYFCHEVTYPFPTVVIVFL